MLTLRELLTDKIYREFFITVPEMPANLHPSQTPWRVYVQKELHGRWARRDFNQYRDAFKFLKPLLKDAHDATIQSRGIAFSPPARVVKVKRNGQLLRDEKGKVVLRRIVWQPILPEAEEPHRWCPYCRRPTVFGWFSKHHAFSSGFEFDLALQRCTICGASERLISHA